MFLVYDNLGGVVSDGMFFYVMCCLSYLFSYVYLRVNLLEFDLKFVLMKKILVDEEVESE